MLRRVFGSLFFGLLVGLGLAVVVGWGIAPARTASDSMRDLERRYKDEFTVLAAVSYQTDCDLTEALNRLRPLTNEGETVFNYVRDVTERYISAQGTGRLEDIRSLVELSCAFGYCTTPMQPFFQPVCRP